MSLLEIKNLKVEFGALNAPFRAVDGLDLSLDAGDIVGIVGESGSGKSVTMMALMGLLEGQGRVNADRLHFDGQNLLALDAKARRKIIGKDISMVFQDPMTSLNPSLTVGAQIAEVLQAHTHLRGSAQKARILELMEMVEIPAPQTRISAYPHQLSGGMSQRVVIAMAIACKPKLLIADEPTTALDVTVQAQIMALLVALQKSQNMALIMITHDLALVAEVAQRVAVMYAGQLVEIGRLPALFNDPHHPYTQALLAAIPEHSLGADRLQALAGIVPGQYDRPKGCLLSPRCSYVKNHCVEIHPELKIHENGAVRCHFPLGLNQ